MRPIFLTISLICFSLLAVAQENKEKQSKADVQITVEDDHDARIKMLQSEIKDIQRRLKELNTAMAPKDEKDRAIYRSRKTELEFHKKWTEKQLSIAQAEAQGQDPTGMRGEAKALKARYTAMRDTRVHLEREAAAQQAEIDDETAVPNTKLKMQKNQLQAEIAIKKEVMNREQNSPNPDAERIAQLEGEIETLQRQVDELKE